MNWKEETKGYGDLKVVTGAKTKIGALNLSIHRHIHYEKDDWLASSIFFDVQKMASKDLQEAKCQAVAVLQVILEDALSDILTP